MNNGTETFMTHDRPDKIVCRRERPHCILVLRREFKGLLYV